MPHLNRLSALWPQPESDPTPSDFDSHDELPAPWIDRPDYVPGSPDPLDLFDQPEFDLVLACSMIGNYGANGALDVELKTGERFSGVTSATLWHRGWIYLHDARWLNGPLHLRGVPQEVLVYHDNIKTAKWNWPDGLGGEGGE